MAYTNRKCAYKGVSVFSVSVIIFVLVSSVTGQDHNLQTPAYDRKGTRCYDDFNRPQVIYK